MSNPGVLTLTKKQISPKRYFRVEDNLGEAIHFHYNDIRVDLTVRELLLIAKECDRAIYDLIPEKDFHIEDYDGDFLNRYSHCLIDLVGIEKGEILFGRLYGLRKGFFGLPVVRRVSGGGKVPEGRDAPGDGTVLEGRDTAGSVVLFNDSPVIMGDVPSVGAAETVPFIRMKFRNNKYSVGMHPWVQFLFCWDKKRIWNLMKKVYERIRK